MALIDEVKTVCDRLAPFGWQDLLLDVTDGSLDIAQATTAKLKIALITDIPDIKRGNLGFEDFHPMRGP
jgi:hypothetical protein